MADTARQFENAIPFEGDAPVDLSSTSVLQPEKQFMPNALASVIQSLNQGQAKRLWHCSDVLFIQHSELFRIKVERVSSVRADAFKPLKQGQLF